MKLKMSPCVMQSLLFVEREVSLQVHHVEISGLNGYGESFSDIFYYTYYAMEQTGLLDLDILTHH
jgi:hypothetical protein